MTWAWSFAGESRAMLQAMGWYCPHTDQDAEFAGGWTYAGSPVRYELRSRGNTRVMPPAAVWPAAEGWCSIATKGTVLPYYAMMFRIYGNTGQQWYISPTGSGLSVYINNTFKGSSAPVDHTVWNFVTAGWDMTGSTWKVSLSVNGGAAVEYTHTASAQTHLTAVELNGSGSSAADSCSISQVMLWTAYTADAAQAIVPRFVTRVDASSDVAQVGSWSPQSGTDHYAMVDGLYDVATYTEVSSASAGDRVEFNTPTIATGLGVTPGSIYGVVTSCFAEGQSLTGEAFVGAGGSTETHGTPGAVSVGTPSLLVAVDTSTAFSGTDTLDFGFEVDAV